MGTEIAVVLPRRESFSSANAGAVALMARDYVRYSRLADTTTVYGAPVDAPLAGAKFQPVSYKKVWWRPRNISYAAACVAAMRKRPPDFIDVHNRVETFLHIAKAFPHAKCALHLHNDPLSMRGARSVRERRRILRHAAAVYCVSEFLRERFLRGVPEAAAKVHVVANGLLPEAEVPSGKAPVILYVGRIIQEKGVDVLADALVEAMPRLDAKWKVVIVGTVDPADAAITSDFEKQVHAKFASLGDRLEYAGFLSYDRVLARFRAAEIVVVPSRWEEPFGRTALEAMATGCAPIATARGGLSGIVGDAGILLDDLAGAPLAAAILRLAGDDELRHTLQRQALSRAADLFDIRRLAAHLDDFRK